jgi:hypothetical protein
MKISDAFKIVTGPGGQWRMALKRPLRTTDARRTRDTRISAETGEYNGAMMGARWTGDLQPVGVALKGMMNALSEVKDRARMRDGLKQAIIDLAKYGNETGAGLSSGTMGPGPSGALSTVRPEKEFSLDDESPISTMQAAADAMWNPNKAAARDTKFKSNGRVTAADVDARNREFWAAQPKPQGKVWGRG